MQPSVSQAEVFNTIGAPAVQNLLDYTNVLLFAFGVTNAGKTFTIFGTQEHPGLVPRLATTVYVLPAHCSRILDKLFDEMQKPSMFKRTGAAPASYI